MVPLKKDFSKNTSQPSWFSSKKMAPPPVLRRLIMEKSE
jgi:hypothetical protein